MPAGSYSFLYGPAMAVIGIAILMVIARWAMQGGTSVVPKRGTEREYGILVPIAAPATREQGQRLVAALSKAGIRANSVDTTQGLRILVWPKDAERARALLGDAATPDFGPERL